MIFNDYVMDPLFKSLEACSGVEQDDKHHPEGDVLEHSVQCFYAACRETYDIDLILAALLHDVGKAVGLDGHEAYSVDILHDRISPKTTWLIKNHMRVRKYLDGEMKKLSSVKELAGHPWFTELIMLTRFDKRGRQKKSSVFDRQMIVDRLNKVVEDRFKYNQSR